MIPWIAMAIALAGAWLVASDTWQRRAWGWAAFLLSNGLWIGVGIDTEQWALVTMQAAFCVTSVRGLLKALG